MNLAHDPSTTVHGRPSTSKDIRPHTNMNWHEGAAECCPVCHRPIIDDYCGCRIADGDTQGDPRLNYTESVQKRIASAIEKARQSTHRAHLMGHNSRFGCDVYTVYSSVQGRGTYTVRVFQAPRLNAFAYLPPYGYILCDCQAGGAGVPCWHSAKVALRIQREQRRFGAQPAVPVEPVAAEVAPAVAVVEPAAEAARQPKKYTLESLFDDVA